MSFDKHKTNVIHSMFIHFHQCLVSLLAWIWRQSSSKRHDVSRNGCTFHAIKWKSLTWILDDDVDLQCRMYNFGNVSCNKFGFFEHWNHWRLFLRRKHFKQNFVCFRCRTEMKAHSAAWGFLVDSYTEQKVWLTFLIVLSLLPGVPLMAYGTKMFNYIIVPDIGNGIIINPDRYQNCHSRVTVPFVFMENHWYILFHVALILSVDLVLDILRPSNTVLFHNR